MELRQKLIYLAFIVIASIIFGVVKYIFYRKTKQEIREFEATNIENENI